MNGLPESDQTWREILYWSLALVGLVGIKELWTARLRPWIEATIGEIEAGGVELPLVGAFDRADLIGVSLLAAGLVVGVGVLAWRVRRRRRWPG